MPTVLVTPGKLEENPPRQILNPRLVIAVDSTGKYMQTIKMIYPNPHVSYMFPGIHKMNAWSREILVLSILKIGLLRTVETTLNKEISLKYSKRTLILLTIKCMQLSCKKK